MSQLVKSFFIAVCVFCSVIAFCQKDGKLNATFKHADSLVDNLAEARKVKTDAEQRGVSILFLCCIKASGQVNFKAIKKNNNRFDCEILQTVFKDSTIFERKNWGRDNHPLFLNDFNLYFENCTIPPLFNRQVVLINKELHQQSDTLTILYVSEKADVYTIDLFQPSSGSDCRIELLKTNNAYKVQKATLGAY